MNWHFNNGTTILWYGKKKNIMKINYTNNIDLQQKDELNLHGREDHY